MDKRTRPFARRRPGVYQADCNGNDEHGCAWRIFPKEGALVEVTSSARFHARESGHETVVTLTSLTVYDGRPR